MGRARKKKRGIDCLKVLLHLEKREKKEKFRDFPISSLGKEKKRDRGALAGEARERSCG